MKRMIARGVILILVLIVICFIGEVAGDYKNRRWDGVNRYTMVVMNKKDNSAQIQSIDPETNEATKVFLPADMEINTVDGRGIWKVSSVVALSKKFGPKWAADSLTNFLEISYTAISDNLVIWDKISWWKLNRDQDWQEIDLSKTTMVSETKAPDGDKVLTLSGWWKEKAGDIFYSANLAKEELRIEVYNTTGIDGLAINAANVLESSGLKVSVVSDAEIKINKCRVVTTTKLKNDTGIRWITKNFNCEQAEDESLQDNEVKVYLGSEYVKWLYGDSL